MRLFDRTTQLLENTLDVRLLRQNVLTSNIANADTPHYRPKDVNFARALEQAQTDLTPPIAGVERSGDMPLAVVHQPQLHPGPGSVIEDSGEGAPGLDGNRVDLERQMSSLAENGLQYGASARTVGKKLAILRYVASDGAN